MAAGRWGCCAQHSLVSPSHRPWIQFGMPRRQRLFGWSNRLCAPGCLMSVQASCSSGAGFVSMGEPLCEFVCPLPPSLTTFPSAARGGIPQAILGSSLSFVTVVSGCSFGALVTHLVLAQRTISQLLCQASSLRFSSTTAGYMVPFCHSGIISLTY